MGILSDLTLEQLRNATTNQILQAKTGVKSKIDNMTKKQFIIFLLRVADIDIDTWQEVKSIIREGDARGQTLEVDEIVDILDQKIGSTRREFTYKGTDPKSPIHFIRTRNYDASGKELIGQGAEIEHLGSGEVVSRPI